MPGLHLGRLVSPATLKPDGGDLRLPAERLVRHAVCVGMTGSGKTGLCVGLLEEVASAGVPVLAIDPKGDLANLALAFRDHTTADFAPWVDPAEATREGLTVDALAERTASRWREGLASWGVDQGRIDRFVDGVDVTVYTPGSTAGVPVDVLSMLDAPPVGLADDAEALAAYVTATVGALLGLVGEQADPVQDPASIVLARILTEGWAAGRPLGLEGLLPALVDPPFDKVGFFPVDTFFPRKDRMALALKLNGVVASPAFAAWQQGVPLDIDALLAPGPDGRTPVRVLYLAHLDEGLRTFFLTLLLEAVVAWSRRQPGTSSLRALLYFDEVYGHLPPHPKDPPTKRPVLTLMKQARAVGLGVVLCTQNPVDVDYKALSNAGTWLVGRLQTAQDRDRVLDGLAGAGGALDRATMDRWIELLPSRTFVVRDVAEREPYLLQARWVISYLRGPLTRREVAALAQEPGTPSVAPPSSTPSTSTPSVPAPAPLRPASPLPAGWEAAWLRPEVALSPRLRDVVDARLGPARADGEVAWEPAVLVRLRLRFDDRDFVADREETRFFFPLEPGFPTAHEVELRPDDLTSVAQAGDHAPLPGFLDEKAELIALRDQVRDEALRGETERTFAHKALKLAGRPGETEEAFAQRVRAAIAERVADDVRKLKDKVDKQLDRLRDRRDKAERAVEKHQLAVRGAGTQEVVNVGETLLSMFFGGRKQLGTAVTRRRQTMEAQRKLAEAQAEVAALDAELLDLEEQTARDLEEVQAEHARLADDVEAVELRLERDDLEVSDPLVVWVPVTRPV